MDSIDEMVAKKASSVAEEKSATTMSNFNKLMHSIRDHFEESLDIEKDKKYFDEGLGEKLSAAITKAFENLSKLPAPKVSVNNTNNIDLQPLQSIAGDISKTNKELIEVIKGMKGGDESYEKECYQIISNMVQKNNSFIDKIFNQKDYSEVLQKISEALNSNKPKEWTATITKRNSFGGQIEEITFKSR